MRRRRTASNQQELKSKVCLHLGTKPVCCLFTKHPAGALILVDPDVPLARGCCCDSCVHDHGELGGAAVGGDAVDD